MQSDVDFMRMHLHDMQGRRDAAKRKRGKDSQQSERGVAYGEFNVDN